jgi:hypothetical protein
VEAPGTATKYQTGLKRKLAGTNTLAYFAAASVTAKKSFMTSAPGFSKKKKFLGFGYKIFYSRNSPFL